MEGEREEKPPDLKNKSNQKSGKGGGKTGMRREKSVKSANLGPLGQELGGLS